MGQGLLNVRDEYGKELIRTATRLAWWNEQDGPTGDPRVLFALDKESNNSMFNRAMKVLKKKVEYEEFRKYFNQLAEQNYYNFVQYIMEWIEEKIDNYYIEKWKEQKVAGAFRRAFENEHVERKLSMEVWKNLNIKRSAYVQIVRMQEGSTMNGNKRAQITGCTEKKYCKICKHRVATNAHILLSCPLNKKKQIQKHDYLAEAVYHAMEDKLGFQREVKPKHFRKGLAKTLTWNAEVVSRSYGKFPKKPDVFYKTTWYAVIIDIAIVADENINKGYVRKINAYTRLSEALREKMRILRIKIIPVIATINGLINKHSVDDLAEIDITINWEKVFHSAKL